MTVFRIGVISDTHGLLRKEALHELEHCDQILHAGDVGKAEILEALRILAPLTAVRGNVDQGAWAERLPETAVVEVGNRSFYLLHDIGSLQIPPAAAGFSAVIYGHSHHANQVWKDEVLYLNPGSAGPQRFGLPVTMARILIEGNRLDIEWITLAS